MKKILDLNELNAIKLYELKYIDQTSFFDLITGCGEQTIAEEGINRLSFYLKLVANSEREEHRNDFSYFIIQYPIS